VTTSTEATPSEDLTRERPRPAHAARGRSSTGPVHRVWAVVDRRPLPVILLALAAAAFLCLWNLPRAPDFVIDETLYVEAGRHAIHGNSLTFALDPIVVHPPLFFLSVGLWLAMTGDLRTDALHGIASARHLDALYVVLVVLMVAVLARCWSQSWAPADRGRLLLGALVLTAVDPFLLRFGRAVLIEPMAVLAALTALAVAWRMRRARTWTYATVVGAFVGIALLVKEPVVFLVAAPLAAAVLQRSRRDFGRHGLALVVGVLVWSAFPLWAVFTGNWDYFYDVHTLSLRRILGTAQTSGLNRPGVSPLASVKDTLGQYAGGYVLFAAAAVVLAVGVWRALRRPRSVEAGSAQILALGVAAFGFLVYSLGFGQANEQLTVYTVPASALLVAGAPVLLGRPRAAVRAVVVAVPVVAVLTLSGFGWASSFTARDDGTARVAAYVGRTFPACAPVNATGDADHWEAVLRTQPLTAYDSGPEALANGVHVFLDSPKDAEFHYGFSNAGLSAWLARNGEKVFEVPSHTYRSIAVYVVGDPVTPDGQSLPGCVATAPDPHDIAQASVFGRTFAATLGVVLLAAVGGLLPSRRRKGPRDAPPAVPASPGPDRPSG
jgi:4-amino-4-deoxy-L-arabinose transferase-like glycosyltransferase